MNFLRARGMDVEQSWEVRGPTSLPKCGAVFVDGNIIRIVNHVEPRFGVAPGLSFDLVPEPVPSTRKRKAPASGLVHEPMQVQKFGTIRWYVATHCFTSIVPKGLPRFPEYHLLQHCLR